jgi:hypothetical protein
MPEAPRSYLCDPQKGAWIEVVKAIERDRGLNNRVLGALAKSVFRAFREAVQQDFFPDACYPLILPDDLERQARRSGAPAIAGELVDALHAWSAEWHMPSHGFWWIALQTMFFWQQGPDLARRRRWGWCTPTEAQPYHGTLRVSFSANAWHPQTEPREVAKRRIMRELELLVERHLEDTRIDFVTPGIIFSERGARSAPVKHVKDHFDWFVRFQVKGESFGRISRSAAMGRVATQRRHRTVVQRAVDAVGTLLDGERWLSWRRPAPRGRPRSNTQG